MCKIVPTRHAKLRKITLVYTLTQQTSQNIYFKKFPHSFLRFPTFCNFSIAVPRNSSTRDLPRLLTTWGPVSTELCLVRWPFSLVLLWVFKYFNSSKCQKKWKSSYFSSTVTDVHQYNHVYCKFWSTSKSVKSTGYSTFF